MLSSPLLIDLDLDILPIEPIVDIPNSNEEIELLEEPIISNTYYYLIIYPPQTNNSLTNLPAPSIKVHIPTNSLVKGKVRLKLPPSIGFGINACYKIEYWQWNKTVVPTDYIKFAPKIFPKLIHIEYWHIPTVDRYRLLSYRSYVEYKSLNNNRLTVNLLRSGSPNDSLINNLDVIDIVSIYNTDDSSQIYQGWSLIDTTIPTSLPNEDTPQLLINWVNSLAAPSTNTSYTVLYNKPLSRGDVLWRDKSDNSTQIREGTYLPGSINIYSPFGIY
ncbi:hypothetical protein H6G33_10605 [Calothrix sp. FACHB-1219]|uniref:hypothetical protein n=1 Tax=unclassified Calothrix TaxID=2619626 RepID=UPI001684BA13|nr:MULTISPECIES: hypothetical protein [unclassified Calothrix]MBD2201798.1 hypothetical protein [Calothrix sp. FACHB-168]MBD2217484.1 hypothetical protein [Calothrix sp. FACHB-1219]